MATKLKDKITDTIKKLGDAAKNVSNNSSNSNDYVSETGAPKGDIGTGNGTSPRTGEKTYSSSNTSSSSIGTSTNYGTYEEDLKKLSEAQKKNQISQLKQARDKALANLDVQEQTIKPTYQNARNQASATSQSSARSFAEYLANRGLTNSGASAQGEINRLSSLQSTLGNIGTAEANAYRDIANQRTAIQNDYVAGVANANNAIAQEYYNNLLNYNQQKRAMVQQLQQQALGQYSDNYQAQIDNLLAQGYSPNSLEVLNLQALRGQKMNNNYNSAMNNALSNIQAGNINYNNAAAVGMTVPQAQQYYNNYIAQQQAQAQAEAEQLAFENRIKEQQLANDTAQTNYNINKPYYKEAKNTISNPYTISNLKDMIKNNYAIYEYDELTGYDKAGIINKIEDLYNEGNGVIDEPTRNLIYDTYGIKY